jgi:hypothetical protein
MNERRQTATAQALLGLVAETSVHASTGAQLGAVGLPIRRRPAAAGPGQGAHDYARPRHGAIQPRFGGG